MYNSTKQNNNYAGPRFNSSNPIPFFALFISFCQANGCGTLLKTSSGKVADVKPLNTTEHAELAEMGTPSRASATALDACRSDGGERPLLLSALPLQLSRARRRWRRTWWLGGLWLLPADE